MGISVKSERPQKLTKTAIEAAWKRRAKGVRLIVRDKDCRGLALIVNPNAMAWSYAYRPRGTDPLTGRRWPNRTITIGNPATHSPDDARVEANRIKGQAAAGADPAVEKKAAAMAVNAKRARTVGRLIEEYAAALPKRPKLRGSGVPSPGHVADELAHVRAAVEHVKAADKPVANLSASDLRDLLTAEASRPATARARFGALGRFLDWCLDAGHVQANPCALITRARRPRAPQGRAHYLSAEELARLWRAADELREAAWRDLARFLIAVPCRRSEAASLDWSHVDTGAAVWSQPGKLTKSGEPHRLHLHPLALDVLAARKEVTGGTGLVFPAPVSGQAITTFSDLKSTLDNESGLAGWTFHDFRRSFASALGEAGIPEAIADAVLNHRQAATRGGVLGVYQRAARWPEQVAAMQRWGAILQAAIAPERTI
jgi:integrase